MIRAARTWIATGLVAIYALCILAPSAALAFSQAPCFMEQGHRLTNAHPDGGGEPHKHVDTQDSDDHGSAPTCCGFAFASAITPGVDVALAVPAQAAPIVFAITQDFSGLPPDKLIRPPKSLS